MGGPPGNLALSCCSAASNSSKLPLDRKSKATRIRCSTADSVNRGRPLSPPLTKKARRRSFATKPRLPATASTLPILGKGAVEQALRQRKHRPMFMVDLAVPRDIEEQVAELDDVYLYTVDDLREVVEENMESRRAAADEAEKIIDLQTAGFMRWLKSLDAVPTILDLRAQIEQITQAELERAQRRLRAGDDPEQVLQLLAHCISQKLSHAPSDQLHKADSDSELIEAARRLFKLDSDR